MNNTFEGFLVSRFAIAVASCAGPKPMQSKSYIAVDDVVGKFGMGSSCRVVCSVDVMSRQLSQASKNGYLHTMLVRYTPACVRRVGRTESFDRKIAVV